MKGFPMTRTLTLAALIALSSMEGAVAQEKPELKIELNGIADAKDSCRFTFVLSNAMPAEISKAAFEFAFFSKAGAVERLTVLNFGRLQKGRTTVRQFDIPGGDCTAHSRVLVNAVKSCDGIAGETEACEAALATGNKTTIDFGM
jgi:hypothetical protein